MIKIMLALKSLILASPADHRLLEAGKRLFRFGEPVVWLFAVQDGEVALERLSANGQLLIVQRARAGDVLAEASFFAEAYHCDAVALMPSRVAGTSLSQLKLLSRTNATIMDALARHLAAQVQQTRLRSELLLLRKVSERLNAWLEFQGTQLPRKGHWSQIAAEIGVTPEALYREIARRKERERRPNGHVVQKAPPRSHLK